MSDNRRDFLKKGTLLGLSGLVGKLIGNEKLDHFENAAGLLSGPAFRLPALPYAYNALEPFIDARTMEIHYTKHHQAYIDKLNATPSDLDYSVNDDLKCRQVDEKTPAVIRNNLGGYYNHSLFWTLLQPSPKPGEVNQPKGKLSEALIKQYGSLENFKKEFSEAAVKIFGSGWCWLIEQNLKFKIVTTPNQDNPLMKVSPDQGPIILALDVWEHAYYLKYQNKRADYIANWWNVVNWEKAEFLYIQK